LFGPVPVTVITAPVVFECGEVLQPPANVAIVTSNSIAKAACRAPRRLAEGLRRHRPASRSNSPPSTGTNRALVARAGVFEPPAGHFPIPVPDFLPRMLPSVSSVIASIVVAGAPFGVIECGSNSQSIPSGTFEQENCTCWLNPFVGVTVTTARPGCDALTVTLDGETDSVKFPAAAVMLIEAAVEVDVAKFASPPYCAVIECVPVESVDVEKVVEPEPLSVPGPRFVAPSRNITVPVGTFVPFAGVTLAMNVTFVPDVAVAGPVSVVVVEMSAPAFTTSDKAGEVLVENFESPLYFAVMECVPCMRVVVATAAEPPLIVAGAPICVALSKNVMVPVSVPAVADVEVAVNVTVRPTVAGFKDETTVVDVGAVVPALTVWLIVGEVLGA
jgi:hypothetical protein